MALIEKLTAIADAIRGKTGGTEEMTLDAMVSAIEGIEVGGGGIPYATGSFTLAANGNATFTHNLNSTKVFVVYAVRDNPAVYTSRYKAIMGFAISNGVYPQLTIDTSGYNQGHETLVTNFQTGPDDTKVSTECFVASPYAGYTGVEVSSARIVNSDANTFTIRGREGFNAGLLYEWIAVDISGVIPWAQEG